MQQQDDIIEHENQFYISANSSYADSRIKVLNHSDTFGIFDRKGDIKQVGEPIQGIYHEGTRFLSESEFRVNGFRPLLLSSSVKEENEILSVDLTNEALAGLDNKHPVPKSILHIARSKFLSDGALHEMIEFVNFGNEKYEFTASINFHADFKDIFEVRGINREKRGQIFEKKHLPGDKLCIRYRGLDDIERTTMISLSRTPETWEGEDKAVFYLSLEPHARFVFEYSALFGVNKIPDHFLSYEEARKKMENELLRSRKQFAHVFTSNEQFNHWIDRSEADLISLLAKTQYGRYPYAGVPWYNTAFGRDGIITAYQALLIAPEIARDVLLFLAKNQATEINSYQDAEPGKILHELRGGEMVECKEVPFKRYYGSVDSTPLFIMLAGAYYKRTANLETIREIWSHILAALQWIDKYGDMDKDGFIEYQYKSESGLINQGWKDSLDSIHYENGDMVRPPVALCEVQGYVYDAKMQAAMLAALLGEEALSARLKEEATQLKQRFHEAFWDEELGTYVIALDGEKKPCRVRASNAGHCLFAGIADAKVAHRVVQTLLSEEMFSGWGIRTLSSREKRYNPMSYHNGSVWPHDVAMIGYGFERYGYRKEAMQLTGALFDASLFIDLQRLPELFCGFTRRKGEGPTSYPVACSPQAWSVGAVFMLLSSCLHMEIHAPEKKVFFRRPSFPDFLSNILINDLRLDNECITIELHRYKDGIGLDVKENLTDWEIMLIK